MRPPVSYHFSSPSSRRAWIEIRSPAELADLTRVALLAEGVDRNTSPHGRKLRRRCVALLAEGVDRNNYMAMAGWKSEVALLAEGVDRNPYEQCR